jgi:hypothetical protein
MSSIVMGSGKLVMLVAAPGQPIGTGGLETRGMKFHAHFPYMG